MRVLVTSAYGNQGRLLIPKLVQAGARVRAMDVAEEARGGLSALGATEIMIADATDCSFLERAVAGMDAVYHIGPNAHPQEREMGLSVIDAAVVGGVKHFVYSSVLHPSLSALRQHLFKRDVEEHLIESGLPFTVLQPAHYMQTLQHRHAFEHGVFRLTWSLERRQALIDVADITTVAAKVLTEGAAHFHATYELSSDDCLSGFEIAARIAEITGKPVETREVPPEEVISTLFPRAQSAALFEQYVALFKKVAHWYSSHDFTGNSAVLRVLLGREPRSVRQFLQDEYGRWVGAR